MIASRPGPWRQSGLPWSPVGAPAAGAPAGVPLADLNGKESSCPGGAPVGAPAAGASAGVPLADLNSKESSCPGGAPVRSPVAGALVFFWRTSVVQNPFGGLQYSRILLADLYCKESCWRTSIGKNPFGGPLVKNPLGGPQK